jgi:hypothetical protein
MGNGPGAARFDGFAANNARVSKAGIRRIKPRTTITALYLDNL